MKNFFDISTDHLSPIGPELSEQEIIDEITKLKIKLKDDLVILGHHYQHDDIIQFADIKGDSLKLAQEAAKVDKNFIIFCGVHFMAETADMLTKSEQSVILPDLNAGCSMADMVTGAQLEQAWKHVTSCSDERIIPITYVNCSAEVKAFVGKHGGCICTSSNAAQVIRWALEKGDKLFFFPDQHLGRNISFSLNIPLAEMCTYNPNMLTGGVSDQEIINSKVILWHGFCSVHQGFTKKHIQEIRKKDASVKVIVHPECSFDVVQAADSYGSTSQIINEIKQASPGSKFAVGTEINLVNRLADEMPDKQIFSLSPYQCLCTTMYRVRPAWLLKSLQAIDLGNPINIIKVDNHIRENSLKAIHQMLEIS